MPPLAEPLYQTIRADGLGQIPGRRLARERAVTHSERGTVIGADAGLFIASGKGLGCLSVTE